MCKCFTTHVFYVEGEEEQEESLSGAIPCGLLFSLKDLQGVQSIQNPKTEL